MESKYEVPEEVNVKYLMTLGREVEMKTFQTRLKPNKGDQRKSEPRQEFFLIKILCVGGSTGSGRTKGVFIKDYLQVTPPVKWIYRVPIYVDFSLKILTRQQEDCEEETPCTIFLQIWEIPENTEFLRQSKTFFKHAHGALVFWGPQYPSSLTEALGWRKKIKDVCPSIPCVLLTDNVPGTAAKRFQYIGPGNIFESEASLEKFCQEHGFVDRLEISARDWESGEKSVFGQAVNVLLERILRDKAK